MDTPKYKTALIVGAVGGAGVDELTAAGRLYTPPGFDAGEWGRTLSDDVRFVAAGRYGGVVRAGFSAVECLHAALWAVRYATGFEAAVCRAASLGDDSDTAAAVAGQLAGAIWGYSAIPARWTKAVAWHDRLIEVADGLYELSGLGKAA